MQTYKKDELITTEENVLALIGNEDEIRYSFKVCLLDHPVIDMSSPMLFVSNRKLIIAFDETVEEYELEQIQLGFTGELPQLTIVQLLLETQYKYGNMFQEDLARMRGSEPLLKISILEDGQIPKDFLIREDIYVKRTYQNWAIGTILHNHKHGLESDPLLFKMKDSLFYSFNSRTVLTFAAVTLVYFLIRLLLVPNVPDIIGTIFDVVYGLMLIFMGGWLGLTLKKNLERYQAVFNSYVAEENSDYVQV